MKRKTYWVYLNGKYIANYRTLRGCLDFIERRKLEYNYDNDLGIIDNEGNEYHPYTGKMMNESINEWNMWDGDRRSSYPRQTRMIDDRKPIHNKARYNNDPEYHEHIKRLEDELRRTDDPQHAEYLERRISRLKSLGEGVKLSRTSRAINEGERSSNIRNEIANKNAELLCELKFDLLDLLEEYYRLSGTYEVNVRYKTVNGVEVSKISTELDDVDYEDARILRWRPSGSKLEPITVEEYDFYISKVEELIKKYEKGYFELASGDTVKRLVNHYKDYRVFICRGFQYRGAKYAEDDKETKNTPAPGGYKVMTFEERINRLCEYYAAFDIRIDRENKTLYINAFSANDLY
jgi:hypothetical protein